MAHITQLYGPYNFSKYKLIQDFCLLPAVNLVDKRAK